MGADQRNPNSIKIEIPSIVEEIDSYAFDVFQNAEIIIYNDPGEVMVAPNAFTPTASVKYVGKKAVAKPKPEPKPIPKAKPTETEEPDGGAVSGIDEFLSKAPVQETIVPKIKPLEEKVVEPVKDVITPKTNLVLNEEESDDDDFFDDFFDN